MSERVILNSNRVVRYFGQQNTECHKNVPTQGAFELKLKADGLEKYLSVFWLEHYRYKRLENVRRDVCKSVTVPRSGSGRLAVLNVAEIKNALAVLGLNGMVRHLHSGHEPSHSGVLGFGAKNRLAAASLARLVKRNDVVAARK